MIQQLQIQPLGSQATGLRWADVRALCDQLDGGFGRLSEVPSLRDRMPSFGGLATGASSSAGVLSRGLPAPVRYSMMSMIGVRPIQELLAEATRLRANAASFVPGELVDALVEGLTFTINNHFPKSDAPHLDAVNKARRAQAAAEAPNAADIRQALADLGALDLGAASAMRALNHLGRDLVWPSAQPYSPPVGVEFALGRFFGAEELLYEPTDAPQYAEHLADLLGVPMTLAAYNALSDDAKAALNRDRSFSVDRLRVFGHPFQRPARFDEMESNLDSELARSRRMGAI